MTDLETAIMIKNIARETVRRIAVKNARSDAELLRIYEKAEREDSDIFFDLTKPKYGLTREENNRAIQLARTRDKNRLKEIGHDRGKRIAEDRKARRGY